MLNKKIMGAICGVALNYANIAGATSIDKEPMNAHNPSDIHFGYLSLKPDSNNLDYAYFVSGQQPYYQDWHSQAIKPDYTSAYELGFNYGSPNSAYNASVDWMHLYSNDSASIQASNTINPQTNEFVGPPFEMSPPVFGLKRADSTVNFNFNNVTINVGEIFEPSSNVHARLFGGVNILRLNQTLTTVFTDYMGAVRTPYSYTLPADPTFSFQLQSVSKYMGAGPDLGLNVAYNLIYGIGLIGQAQGSLNVGTISAQDNFTSTSQRLTAIGIGVSHQAITTPNKTQVVPGFDGKLGLFYRYSGSHIADLTIEGGYRVASFINAISTIVPGTLVQPGTTTPIPEFATGTMAIVSVLKQDRPFNLNGPYVELKMMMG